MAQTREYKTIQAGMAMVDIVMAPLVSQGFRPILMSSSADSKGTIFVVVILEKIITL
jgi:hypothetical protein